MMRQASAFIGMDFDMVSWDVWELNLPLVSLVPFGPSVSNEIFPRTQDGETSFYDVLREIFLAHVNTRPHVGLRLTTAIVYEV